MINRLMLIIVVALLPATVLAATLKVSWDANTEEDLAGYRVYYAIGGDPEWQAERGRFVFSGSSFPHVLDVGNVTVCDIEDVPVGPYVVAVTAYDASENESGYSEPASGYVPGEKGTVTVVVDSPPDPPKGLVARIIESVISWIKGLFGLSTRTV
jgi:hypothetical protein